MFQFCLMTDQEIVCFLNYFMTIRWVIPQIYISLCETVYFWSGNLWNYRTKFYEISHTRHGHFKDGRWKKKFLKFYPLSLVSNTNFDLEIRRLDWFFFLIFCRYWLRGIKLFQLFSRGTTTTGQYNNKINAILMSVKPNWMQQS